MTQQKCHRNSGEAEFLIMCLCVCLFMCIDFEPVIIAKFFVQSHIKTRFAEVFWRRFLGIFRTLPNIYDGVGQKKSTLDVWQGPKYVPDNSSKNPINPFENIYDENFIW